MIEQRKPKQNYKLLLRLISSINIILNYIYVYLYTAAFCLYLNWFQCVKIQQVLSERKPSLYYNKAQTALPAGAPGYLNATMIYNKSLTQAVRLINTISSCAFARRGFPAASAQAAADYMEAEMLITHCIIFISNQ